MVSIPGYHIVQELYEGEYTLVCRARRHADNQPVILKTLRQLYPPPGRIEQLKNEYALLSTLDLAGVVRPYALETDQHTWVLVLEDIGGEALSRLTLTSLLDLGGILRLAIQVADILGQLHQQHIIHRDISPANIVYNPTSGDVRLIDFGLAVTVSAAQPTFRSSNTLEGTLAYMSPEQTGRMDRDCDYRADLYSFGATLYELLSGQPPFASADTLELLHSHIARAPVPLHTHNLELPRLLSSIVMKLMAKNAEDRYQSAYGLRIDLGECLRQWLSTGHIEPFALGQHDGTDRFAVPARLYGRSPELHSLTGAFRQASGGESRAVLLTGSAGMGKSALAAELCRPVTQQGGFFVAGQFQPVQHGAPYAAIIEALRVLVRQLLTGSEADIAVWRSRLSAALGRSGQVLIDVLPELELIIGAQPALPTLGPAEAQNRFSLALQRFLRAFARAAHPLALVLDNAQWADTASLSLLERLLLTSRQQHMLVLLLARDHDLDADHPLPALWERLRQAGASTQRIELGPLEVAAVTRLVAETLQCAVEHARPLAELVAAKTDGNPFFLHEFLQALYGEGMITFDYEQRRWQWRLEQIQAHEMTDNVIELMASKVQRFATPTRNILKRAACIGNQFDLVTLAVVSEQTPAAAMRDLAEALGAGLLEPVPETYTLLLIGDEGQEDEVPAEYRFAHDRIRQAVYSLIPPADRPALHWQVGQLLLWSMPPAEREERIYEIVYQLNQGSIFLGNAGERVELAAFNLLAGRRARQSAAHEAALRYFTTGVELLDMPDDYEASNAAWAQHHDLLLALYSGAAESAYLVGRLDDMERLADVVLLRVDEMLERVGMYEVLMLARRAQHQPRQAVHTGLHVLAQLGVALPEHPGPADVMHALEETTALLAEQPHDTLAQRPPLHDPVLLAALRVLLHVAGAARDTLPDLYTLAVLQQVQLSLRHGHAPVSAVAYANYGALLCERPSSIDAGYRFGQLALHVLDQLESREHHAHTHVTVHALIRPWKEHLDECLPPLRDSYQMALTTGDIEFAAQAAQSVCALSFWAGQELNTLEHEMASYGDTLGQPHQDMVLHMHCIYHQTVHNLLDRAEHPTLLRGEIYDEIEMLPSSGAADERPMLAVAYGLKLLLCYLFGEYTAAVEQAERAMACFGRGRMVFPPPIFAFYDSLALLAFLSQRHGTGAPLPEDDLEELGSATLRLPASALIERVDANQKLLKQWAQYAPMNYLHKYCLVEAERARLTGREGSAWEYYHKAIRLSAESGYLPEEALANELAARFYLEKGQPQFATVCVQDSYYAYLRWGALARAKDLEVHYPDILAQAISPPDEQPVTRSTQRPRSSAVDLVSVIRASQAMTDNVFLDTLLATLVRLVIENAGAERGVLVLPKESEWVIEAEGAVNQAEVAVLQSQPVEPTEGAPRLPLSVLNYVARTKETVVLNDASAAGQFGHDSYFAVQQPRSILCAPMLNQGALTGMLYLENNLTAGAFTPDRLEVLSLLSAQAAISIEKAKLYTTLQDALEQQKALTQAYSRFVPREILQFLGKESITQVVLGDQTQREMTVLFSDIRAFTTLSEQMTPQQNFNFINSYLSRVGPVIREHSGFIDKYIGDAIMALFPNQPNDAIQAAIHMQREVQLYNEHRANHDYQPIQIGIGLHVGSVMLGTIGDAERMEGTVISDTVNLTARLEELTKLYGAAIIVSERTLFSLSQPDQYALRSLGTVRVKGKQDAVAVFEILDGLPDEMRARREATSADFEQGLLHYWRQQFDEAVAYFEQVLAVDSDDQAARLYLSRATRCITYGIPADWDSIDELKVT
jgi:predicted ATPase/class 3 adenylate cyclase